MAFNVLCVKFMFVFLEHEGELCTIALRKYRVRKTFYKVLVAVLDQTSSMATQVVL